MKESRFVRTSLDDLTYKITGCAMALHRRLGPGHREHIYQRFLQDQLSEAGMGFEPQKLYEVFDGPGKE